MKLNSDNELIRISWCFLALSLLCVLVLTDCHRETKNSGFVVMVNGAGLIEMVNAELLAQEGRARLAIYHQLIQRLRSKARIEYLDPTLQPSTKQ